MFLTSCGSSYNCMVIYGGCMISFDDDDVLWSREPELRVFKAVTSIQQGSYEYPGGLHVAAEQGRASS